MKERLKISEMAKLRNLTSETLRHYDRVGLFKPEYVDRSSGYRYYSIYQYEVLGTIKELREIGMSIEDIHDYLEERNLRKSLSILERKHEELLEKLSELQQLEVNVREKIEFMRVISRSNPLNEIEHKRIPERKLITKSGAIHTFLELCYGVIELENTLQEIAPIVGTNRLGVLIDQEHLTQRNVQAPSVLFVTARGMTEPYSDCEYVTISGGEFVCSRYAGELWDRAECLTNLLNYMDSHQYMAVGPALQIAHTDISVTDVPSEITFEIQIPVANQKH
ncbi:MerR family transcriptional regulator [Paenibacillus paeoniae]|uniref:MerR family transcriptional regulator n=1 Tax=Paenibacillus paeoniae TaxID=2292705 RepID=A0A371PKT5_9BACL|nr:MerR family transcriptional regulator [Paenibacillus paeoniae]REK76820.1 MerR family transcriptional regulator [Paenibacillus paeoniae]